MVKITHLLLLESDVVYFILKAWCNTMTLDTAHFLFLMWCGLMMCMTFSVVRTFMFSLKVMHLVEAGLIFWWPDKEGDRKCDKTTTYRLVSSHVTWNQTWGWNLRGVTFTCTPWDSQNKQDWRLSLSHKQDGVCSKAYFNNSNIEAMRKSLELLEKEVVNLSDRWGFCLYNVNASIKSTCCLVEMLLLTYLMFCGKF